MKIVYFDATSGISGDMAVGALLDAGGAVEEGLDRLATALESLPVGGYRLAAERVEVGTIGALSFRVHVDDEKQAARDWREIRTLIEEGNRAGLSDAVAGHALAIFAVLARAEAKVHGVDEDRVTFHEVGAIDSIIDIVATAWCLDELGVESCFVGPLPLGSGHVKSAHGRLPVPAPATALLLEGFEVIAGDGEGELVTPTGAAILAATAKPLRPSFTLLGSGVGAGTRRLADRPNVLRVLIGDADEVCDEEIIVIEADIDDMTPEALAYAAERLRAAGARDVTVAPLQMKKGRLGMRLTVLADLDGLEGLASCVLAETTTLGVRYRSMRRAVLPRRSEIVDTEFGPIAVKIAVKPDGSESPEPEFEDVARAASSHGRPFAEVRAAALAAFATGTAARRS